MRYCAAFLVPTHDTKMGPTTMQDTVNATDVIQQLSSECLEYGLDIVQPFTVGRYNERLKAGQPLPKFGHGPSCLAVLIGNSKVLWPAFVQSVAQSPALLAAENPLDQYIEQSVAAAVDASSLLSSCQHGIWFGHDTSADKFVDMLWAAEVSGLAFKNSSAHLCVHPVYGPWFALRAIVVVDLDASHWSHAAVIPDPIPEKAGQLQEMAQAILNQGASWKDSWREWLALRDACCNEQTVQYRYCDAQVEYHYTKGRQVLLEEVARATGGGVPPNGVAGAGGVESRSQETCCQLVEVAAAASG